MATWTKIDKTTIAEHVQYEGEDIYYDGIIVAYDGITWMPIGASSASWTTV